MAVHPCPVCKLLIPVGVQYCPKCLPVMENRLREIREHNRGLRTKTYNRGRDDRYLSFYRSKSWRMTSKSYLQHIAYLCEGKTTGCRGLAVEVHHKQPIQTKEGWNLRLDWSNLEGLCIVCHNARHHRGKREEDGVIDMKKIITKT